MPITTLIKGVPPSLPLGFCLSSDNLQSFVNEIFKGTWQFQSDVGNSFFNMGDSVPAPENRSFPWLKTNAGLPERWYYYALGAWIWPYSPGPGPNGLRWEWEGTEADLKTFEGGNANAVSIIDGPFWEIDHNYDARSSMGAMATLPVSGTPFTVGTDAGEEKHTQTLAELAGHTHTLTPKQLAQSPGSSNVDGILFQKLGTGSGDTADPTEQTMSTEGSSTPFNVIHPVRANYKIKRSIRQFYSIP